MVLLVKSIFSDSLFHLKSLRHSASIISSFILKGPFRQGINSLAIFCTVENSFSDKLLIENGHFWVLLPHHEAILLENKLSNFGLQIESQIHIKNYQNEDKISRTINCFCRNKTLKSNKIMAIYKDKNRDYTNEFIELLKPYYLYL